MQDAPPEAMPEEGPRCPCPLPLPRFRGPVPCPLFFLVVAFLVVAGLIVCLWGCFPQQLQPPPTSDVAELQVNLTAPRTDPRLRWIGHPAWGRSFVHGPQLEQGQLRMRRAGIYRLHVQVTLANCSSPRSPRPATLTLGVCSDAGRSVSLLRLSFGPACSVAGQRLTPLAAGDTLCVDLPLPLVPSRNADDTFLGVQLVRPERAAGPRLGDH